MPTRRRSYPLLIPLFALLLGACLGSRAAPAPPTANPPVTTPSAIVTTTVTLWAVGDAATCGTDRDDAVARFLANQEGLIALLGDVVYEKGTSTEFGRCFDPIYGQLKDRLRPAVGNHEYGTRGAQGYFDYFGSLAGEPGRGWYSYDVGAWHVIVLNSNCKQVGGCGPDSPQYQWLLGDLTAHPTLCTLAYWHHPRWSSGEHGNFESMQSIWELLYRTGVDLVLSGHDHDYERFLPLDAQGQPDRERGIVQFVVGTGGRSLRPLGDRLPTSAIGTDRSYGVLELHLSDGHYAWRFHTVAGAPFEDSGDGSCH